MRWLGQLRMRIEMIFRRNRAAGRLEDELRFHLKQQIAENVAAGMNAEEARHAALRAFGNPTALRDQARETWNWSGVELMLRDARIGARTLWRTPGFAGIAVLVMALGIGANIALFTIVRSVLLRPLPFRHPDRLVRLYEHSNDDKFLQRQRRWRLCRMEEREPELFRSGALGLCRLQPVGTRGATAGEHTRSNFLLEYAAHAGCRAGAGPEFHGRR